MGRVMMTMPVNVRDAVTEALRESKAEAAEAVTRQRRLAGTESAKAIRKYERADLFLRALDRLGYEVRER